MIMLECVSFVRYDERWKVEGTLILVYTKQHLPKSAAV